MFGDQLTKLFNRPRAEKFGPRRTFHQSLRSQTPPRQRTASTKSSSEGDTESEEVEPEVVVISDSEDETHRETIGLDNRRNRPPISMGKDQTHTGYNNLKSTGRLNGSPPKVYAREQTLLVPRAAEEKHLLVQQPSNTITARSNGVVARTSQVNSAKEIDDIVSEAWLQERLARAETEKKRTIFRSGPPPPVPREKRQKQCMSFRWIGAGSFKVPIKVSKEAKQSDLDINRVAEVEEALSRYLEKDPESERTQQEYEEYTRCKKKLDRGETLVTAERDWMRSIKKNDERREYSFQRKRSPPQMLAADRAKKQKVEPKITKTPMTHAEKADAREVEKDKRIEEVEKALQVFSNPSEISIETRFSQVLDCSPTSKTSKNSLEPEIEPCGKEDRDDSTQSDEYATSRNRIVQAPRKTVARKGLITDIVEQTQYEESPEPTTSDESSSEEEDGGIEVEEPFWQYDVYRGDIADPNGYCDPILIGTYFNRRRAEVVRDEITNIQASLQESCEFEFSCKFELNGIQAQAFTFPSGRSVKVFIEKSVVPEGAGISKRPKKARLPTKHYLVMEETVEMNPEDELFEIGRSIETKRSINKESYIFWQDANKRASKLFIAHQTAQFEGDERFDIGIIGSIDTDGRRYLHELEAGERLFDKTIDVLPRDKDGKRFRAHIWVQEQLLRAAELNRERGSHVT